MADGGWWAADPMGRHEYRYWDGAGWTDQVSDGGVVSADAIAASAPVSPSSATTAAVAPVSDSRWRRFRRLPIAAQAAIWVIVAFVALTALGAAIGPSDDPATVKVKTTSAVKPKATNTTKATPMPTPTTTTTEATDPDEAQQPGAATVAPAVAAVTAATSTSSACRADPLANVYHPARLEVIDPCRSVSGIVETIRHEDDGDWHINVRLDSDFAGLVNAKNQSEESGDLVVEVVPADEAGCVVGQPPKPSTRTYDYGVCTGANVAIPRPGDHVTVTGPYVIDHAHGWMEIHPAWDIRPFLLTSLTTVAAPTTVPVVTAPPTTMAPTTTLAPATTSVPPTTAATSDPYASATAQCVDGTYSYSAHRSGTCSYHGGVARWINPPSS